MSNKYKYVKTDNRNNFEYQSRNNRISNTVVPELKETLRIAAAPPKIFPVNSIEELDLLTREYKHMISTGNLAIIYDNDSTNNQLFVWGQDGDEEGWELVVNNDTIDLDIDGGIF